MKPWYYYLHANGELISKSPAAVESDPDYFKSDFVKKHWKIDLENRVDAWILILEALDGGANVERCQALAEKWGLTRDESLVYLDAHKPTIEQREGLKKFVIHVLKEDPNEYIAWVLSNREEKTPAATPPANGKPAPAAAAPAPPKASPPPLPQPPKKAAEPPAAPKPTPKVTAYTPETKPPAPAAEPAPAATKANSELMRLQQYDKFLVDTEALRITKTEEAQIVKDFIDKARTFMKDAEAATKPEIDETKIRYDAARAKRDAMLKPLKAADAFANRILTEWLVEVKQREIEAQRKADAERRKAEDEARRKADEAAEKLRKEAEEARIAKAAEAKADGKEAEAQRILETPIVIEAPKPEVVYAPVTVVPPPAAAKPGGTGLRETWTWELLNIEEVPEMFTKKVVDEDLVDAVVSKKKGETNIPGIRAFAKNTTVHRSAK